MREGSRGRGWNSNHKEGRREDYVGEGISKRERKGMWRNSVGWG